MKIRTLINWLVAVSVCLVLAGVMTRTLSTTALAQHERDADVVRVLVGDITNLRFILIETILYRETRSEQLWVKKVQGMRTPSTRHHYMLAAENVKAEEIRKNLATVDAVYGRLNLLSSAVSAIDARQGNPDARQQLVARTVSALLVMTQARSAA